MEDGGWRVAGGGWRQRSPTHSLTHSARRFRHESPAKLGNHVAGEGVLAWGSQAVSLQAMPFVTVGSQMLSHPLATHPPIHPSIHTHTHTHH